MLLTESIVNQCFGQELILLLVVAALRSTKLENMSKIKVWSQINCSCLAHPFAVESCACQINQGWNS
jgi:hypothetical protein